MRPALPTMPELNPFDDDPDMSGIAFAWGKYQAARYQLDSQISELRMVFRAGTETEGHRRRLAELAAMLTMLDAELTALNGNFILGRRGLIPHSTLM
jgi:hypothetical protein